MNRTTKVILFGAIAEMALLAAALVVWKGWTVSGPDAAYPHGHTAFPLVFFPLWLAACSAYLIRRLTSDRPRLSDSHRRYINTGLAVASLAMVALHGVLAYSFAAGWTPDRLIFIRVVTVFTGVWMAVQGNNGAKLDPPSGDGAPQPAVWTRTLLRMGWAMALSGVVLVVCGLAAPQPLILPLMVVLVALGVGAELYYRRMTRPGQHA